MENENNTQSQGGRQLELWDAFEDIDGPENTIGLCKIEDPECEACQ